MHITAVLSPINVSSHTPDSANGTFPYPIKCHPWPVLPCLDKRYLTSTSQEERRPPYPLHPVSAPQTNTTSLHASPVFHLKRRFKRRSLSLRQLGPRCAFGPALDSPSSRLLPPRGAEFTAVDDGGRPTLETSTPPIRANFVSACFSMCG